MLTTALSAPLGPAGVHMVAEAINRVTAQSYPECTPPWLETHSAQLREHVALWGAVGYILTRAGSLNAILWLREFEGAGDVEAWMLHNLATTYEREGQFERARPVRERALQLPPDGTHDRHALWAWFSRVLEEDASPASIAAAPPASEEPVEATLRALVELMRSSRDSAAKARAAYRGVFVVLREARTVDSFEHRVLQAVRAAGRSIRRRLPLAERMLRATVQPIL